MICSDHSRQRFPFLNYFPQNYTQMFLLKYPLGLTKYYCLKYLLTSIYSSEGFLSNTYPLTSQHQGSKNESGRPVHSHPCHPSASFLPMECKAVV